MSSDFYPVKYRIEIYMDNDGGELVASFWGEFPFQNINVGDSFSTLYLPRCTIENGVSLQVTRVQHSFSENEEGRIIHDKRVFVETVPS